MTALTRLDRGQHPSFTAPISTAGGAMAPPSPMPFAPNSVCGEGVSKWSMRIRGASEAPGIT
jgi:hypothetical protein